MSHVSHRSTLPPLPDRVGRLTGTAAVSVHATSIAGGTQRDPEGTSRGPRRRCYGHRRGISLPKAPYQNAAQMSRGAEGAEGTTAASGRRDQAGLAARKRRVGAVRGAVPAQNAPKSDRPRAKTPMNRRKSRLRRRAAPKPLMGTVLPNVPKTEPFEQRRYLARFEDRRLGHGCLLSACRLGWRHPAYRLRHLFRQGDPLLQRRSGLATGFCEFLKEFGQLFQGLQAECAWGVVEGPFFFLSSLWQKSIDRSRSEVDGVA